MELFALSRTQLSGGQIALAAVLAIAGFVLLLPRPRGRATIGGVAALAASLAVFAAWIHEAFGNPLHDFVGTVLFWFFALGALIFGTLLVTQRNPARGAIAFAFVILSTCGLFLLLAAPFLMAATIIIYAGAIIVTFLFVLMLSHVEGPSSENDRSREPFLGGLAGFAFVGLVLFTLHLTYLGGESRAASTDPVLARNDQHLPITVLTTHERQELDSAITRLAKMDEQLGGDLQANRSERQEYFVGIKDTIARVVGDSSKEADRTILDGSIRTRLEKSPGRAGEGAVLYRGDQQARLVLQRAATIRDLNWLAFKKLEDGMMARKPDVAAARSDLYRLREELVLLQGSMELPARNVGNLGYVLYADHLLSIELAGTLLLVASIGAVAIAHRKGAAA
jgi:NADH:ubiquinone oxidoreductase subunit 6 (subunit J)